MKNIYFFIILLVLSVNLSYCQNDYKIEKYFKSLDGCQNTEGYFEDLDCVYFRVYYPSFTNPDNSPVNDLVLPFIYKNFFRYPYNNFDKYAQEFFKEYNKSQLEYQSLKWFYDVRVDTIIFNDKIIAISFGSYIFYGGAHGVNKIVTMNYDKTNSRIIDLNDIFIGEYEDKFNKVLNKIVKSQKSNEDVFTYEKEIDFFYPEIFSYDNINNRIIIGKNAIIIYLDYYDECFRMGAKTPLIVPYSLIKTLLTKEYKNLAN